MVMQNASRNNARIITLLVLLSLLLVLLAKRRALTIDEAESDAVQDVVKVQDTVIGDDYVAVVVLAVVALFGFVLWTAIRANQVEDKAMPPASGSSASDTTTGQEELAK
jgi:hypothetical protein